MVEVVSRMAEVLDGYSAPQLKIHGTEQAEGLWWKGSFHRDGLLENKMARPSWDEYFMEITRLVTSRSTCLRRQVGAVIVKDKKILATGYNGAPSGLAHCLDLGCLRERLGIPSGERHELCRGLHAEQNAIVQAAYHGVSIKGATLYCTTLPCIICTKMIINAGIKRVVYEEGYADPLCRQMWEESNVDVEKFKG